MDLVKSGCIWLLSLSYRWIESDFVLKNWRKKWGLGLHRILPIEQWIVSNLTILFLGGAVASLCWASYLGSQHDATRIRSSGACTRYRRITGTRRVQQLSIDICCTRPSSEAHQPHVAAAVHRRDRWMDGRTRDPAPRTMRTAPINLHSGLDYALGWCGIRWVGLRLAKPCLSDSLSQNGWTRRKRWNHRNASCMLCSFHCYFMYLHSFLHVSFIHRYFITSSNL